MKKIAIYGQYLHGTSLEICQRLFDLVKSHQVACAVHRPYAQLLMEAGFDADMAVFDAIDQDCDVLFSIGGDGTILRSALLVAGTDVPVLGVNSGRLGFLATLDEDGIDQAFALLTKGEYTLSHRSLLQVTVNGQTLEAADFALNEVTVSRSNTTSMIQIETHLDDELLTSYWADGLIVSSPTGSTGYSLSCGGPVISPDTDAFVITPIAPHNLNARPLVIPDDVRIRVCVYGREEEFLLSLDNRISNWPNQTVVEIVKSSRSLPMIAFRSQSFIKTIRHKLLWGEDKRN